ncbi:CdaR family transcriptional regulator [Streptomyces sp. AC495_CC817]|uniref:PucR family transcriptional regulator n=1 Tax=Streptomyces sp. AC495_CC817 TaxID=2823900 RepID=UPI001C27F9DC|nr:helix-turn-helix domain-containing protein [Streptomyces sp. AC495_CC817]
MTSAGVVPREDPRPEWEMPPGVTIGTLLDSLGAQMLRPLALPGGRQTLIGSPIIHDADQVVAGLAGAVLLVPGRPAEETVAWAAQHGVAALVVRRSAVDVHRWSEAAEQHGIALIECAPEVAWGQLYTLIDTLHAMSAPAAESDGSRTADLFALANDIALRAGGAVTIEDLSMRVLAYSTIPGQEVDEARRDGILGRRVPAHPSNAEEYAAVLRSLSAVWSTEPEHYRPRLAIAIRDRGEALGTIWVLEGSRPLADDADQVLQDGARQAAPQLARFTLAASAERRQRAEQLGWLLHGTGPTREIAHFFGLAHDEPAAVLVIGRNAAPGAEGFSSSAEASAAYLGDLLRTGLSAYRMPAAASALDGQAIAVVNAPADATVLRSVTATVLAQASERLGGRWRAGVSRTLPGLAEVPRGLIQARQALEVVSRPFGRGEIGVHSDLGAQLLLLEAYDGLQAQGALDGEPLSLLVEHDALAGTNYVGSTRSWIEANYDVVIAAGRLVLHPNTLRYRLRKIADIIDLDDPDTRLALTLQLRLHEIRTPEKG